MKNRNQYWWEETVNEHFEDEDWIETKSCCSIVLFIIINNIIIIIIFLYYYLAI